MTFLLAIDTCVGNTSVALFENGHPIVTMSHRSERLHAARLLRDIDAALTSRSIDLADLSGIAVTIGPGSFTGLRIGLTTAKTLSYAANIPLVGVNTLEALALSANGYQGIVAPVIDARKQEVYAALYKLDMALNRLTELCAPFVDAPKFASERLAAYISDIRTIQHLPDKILLVGDGAHAYSTEFSDDCFKLAPTIWSVVRPENVGTLALQGVPQDLAASWETLEPVYLRRAEAELTLGPPTGITIVETRKSQFHNS